MPDYLARALLATLLFPVAGLVSVYFCVQTNRSIAAGHYVEARRESRLARSWAHAVFWFTLVILLLFGVVSLLDAISPPPSSA